VTPVPATVASVVANYVQTVFFVYILLILAYILTNLLFAFGWRPGYSRPVNAVLSFLRDVSEPYLRIFRRFIRPIGMFDFSPIVAILLLYVAQDLIVKAIQSIG
jgi:YggT family protein